MQSTGWGMLICHDATCLLVLLVVHSSGDQPGTLVLHTEITQQMDFGLWTRDWSWLRLMFVFLESGEQPEIWPNPIKCKWPRNPDARSHTSIAQISCVSYQWEVKGVRCGRWLWWHQILVVALQQSSVRQTLQQFPVARRRLYD